MLIFLVVIIVVFVVVVVGGGGVVVIIAEFFQKCACTYIPLSKQKNTQTLSDVFYSDSEVPLIRPPMVLCENGLSREWKLLHFGTETSGFNSEDDLYSGTYKK